MVSHLLYYQLALLALLWLFVMVPLSCPRRSATPPPMPGEEEKACSIETASPGTRAETSGNGTQRPGQRSGHHGLRVWA